MAALLRLGAARRLGGSVVQRAEEAITEGRRRLGSRLVHTDEEKAARDIRLRAAASLLREVQQKKEELYDMITKAEQSSKTASWSNLRLLQHLSRVITPRPHDTVWDHVQFARKLSSVLKKAGLISLPFMVASWSEYCRDYLDEKVAPAMLDGRRA